MLALSLPVVAALPAVNAAPQASSPPATEARSHPQRLVPVIAAGHRLDSQEFGRLYGPGTFTMNGLANTVIGVRNRYQSMTSLRFRSLEEGVPSSVRLVFPTGKGYSSGNGGIIELAIYPDDGTENHLPDFKVAPLARATYRPDFSQPRTKDTRYPLIHFDRTAHSLHRGNLYHLVLQNTAPSPDQNYSSIDNAVTRAENGPPARWLNIRDWSTLFATRPYPAKANAPYNWTNLTARGSQGNLFSPILQITLANGKVQGVSDMEGGSVDPQRVYTATAEKPIRERFTPRTGKRISGFSVATAASRPGTLSWRIMKGNSRLASGIIQQPTRNYSQLRSTTVYMLASSSWYDVPLSEDIKLDAGESYDLEFHPVGNSAWKFADHQNGGASGFIWPAAFTESQAQHLYDGRWINTFHWDYTRAGAGSNWPVVLHLAPDPKTTKN